MRLLLTFALLLVAPAVSAEVVVKDDSGQVVRLAQPARRIVSLSPHMTENLYAAGAGERIVGTVEFSTFPEAARRLPRIGSYERIDLEAVVALKPDLVIAWQTGNAQSQVDKLRGLGLAVYLSQLNRIEDVAAELERIGVLAGTEAVARPAAARFSQRLAELRRQYAERPRVRTFYQIWKQPLMTVGGQQIISDAMHLCGGENVFAALRQMAANVSVEAVISANPEAIVASGMGDSRPEWLDDWRPWKNVTAVARDNLFFVPPELIQRHTPRILDGTEQMCRHLETARGRRAP